MLMKQKVFSYYLGKWIRVVSVVSGLVVILFSVQNVSGGFIIVILMCLGK